MNLLVCTVYLAVISELLGILDKLIDNVVMNIEELAHVSGSGFGSLELVEALLPFRNREFGHKSLVLFYWADYMLWIVFNKYKGSLNKYKGGLNR